MKRFNKTICHFLTRASYNNTITIRNANSNTLLNLTNVQKNSESQYSIYMQVKLKNVTRAQTPC